MKVELLSFEGCPHWQTLASELDQLAAELRFTWSRTLVESPQDASRLGFHGSPSLHIDGEDPFAEPGAPVGLSCRLYRTQSGMAGSPGMTALRECIVRAASARQ